MEDVLGWTDALVMMIGRDPFVTLSHAIPGTEQETVLATVCVFHPGCALVMPPTVGMIVSLKVESTFTFN